MTGVNKLQQDFFLITEKHYSIAMQSTNSKNDVNLIILVVNSHNVYIKTTQFIYVFTSFKGATSFLKSLGNVTINLQTDGFTSSQDVGVSCMVLVHPKDPCGGKIKNINKMWLRMWYNGAWC